MFTDIVYLVLYPIEHFTGNFLTTFVLYCLCMSLINMVVNRKIL